MRIVQTCGHASLYNVIVAKKDPIDSSPREVWQAHAMVMDQVTDRWLGALIEMHASRTHYVRGSSIVRQAFSHELSCRSDVEAGCDDGDPWNYYPAPQDVSAVGQCCGTWAYQSGCRKQWFSNTFIAIVVPSQYCPLASTLQCDTAAQGPEGKGLQSHDQFALILQNPLEFSHNCISWASVNSGIGKLMSTMTLLAARIDFHSHSPNPEIRGLPLDLICCAGFIFPAMPS